MAWSAIESLMSIIAPEQCKYCQKEGQVICQECFAQHIALRIPACFWCNTLTPYGNTCMRCRRKTSIVGSTIPFRLQDTLRDCIFELKYYGNRSVANTLAKHIVLDKKQRTYDVITYVPSSGRSQRRRGYNQAQLLARALARHIQLPCKELLLRTTHIDQIGLTRAERLAAVQDNFVVKKDLAGLSILLVDDVVTTGATLNECGLQLKRAGARRIWGVAVAKK